MSELKYGSIVLCNAWNQSFRESARWRGCAGVASCGQTRKTGQFLGPIRLLGLRQLIVIGFRHKGFCGKETVTMMESETRCSSDVLMCDLTQLYSRNVHKLFANIADIQVKTGSGHVISETPMKN